MCRTRCEISKNSTRTPCMASMLSAGDVLAFQRQKGTYGGGNMSKRFLTNIEGS